MHTRFRSLVAATLLALAGTPACIADQSETAPEQDVTAAAGHFETFTGDDGLFYFQLIAGNGEELLRSDAYQTLSSARKGIPVAQKAALLPASFTTLQADSGEYFFTLKASNGKLLALGETYATKASADRGLAAVMKAAKTATITAATASGPAFTTIKGDDGKYTFLLRAGNGQVVLQSDPYASKSAATKGITSVKANGVDASNFTLGEGAGGQHYFRVIAQNGQVLGRSGMYASKSGAIHGAGAVRTILRDLAGVGGLTDATAQAEIEKASIDLLFTSESDYPFGYVHAPLAAGASITQAAVQEALASYVDEDPAADKPMATLHGMSQSWQTWKDAAHNCADPNDPAAAASCQKMRNLEQVIESNLTDIHVYYFGAKGSAGHVDGIGVSVFLVGRSPAGNLVGVRTLAIWT